MPATTEPTTEPAGGTTPSGSGGSGGSDGSTGTVDKRRLRSERGRAQVVGALLALYDEGDPEPSAARIAERAGVSERSVFRYFADLESLAAAAIEQQIERIRDQVVPLDAEGDVATRIAAIVDHRLDFHELVATVAHAGRRLEHRSQLIADAFAWRRDLLRQQVEHQFAAELAACPRAERAVLLDALDAAVSFEQIDNLRSQAGMTPARARAVATTTLHALLAEPREHP